VASNKLCSQIAAGFPYIWAEILHAVEYEMSITVEDVMMRRMDLFHEAADGALDAASEIGRYMARFLNSIDTNIEREVAGYTEKVRSNLGAFKG
jgi:glycerol-3-phosphate dehydrogenase